MGYILTNGGLRISENNLVRLAVVKLIIKCDQHTHTHTRTHTHCPVPVRSSILFDLFSESDPPSQCCTTTGLGTQSCTVLYSNLRDKVCMLRERERERDRQTETERQRVAPSDLAERCRLYREDIMLQAVST